MKPSVSSSEFITLLLVIGFVVAATIPIYSKQKPEKRSGGFNRHQEWGRIFFREKNPVYFSYAVTKAQDADPHFDVQKHPHAFAARARGDLDGDGNFSEFYRIGVLDESSRKVVPYNDLQIFQEFE
jgi:hypothetical protein